MTKFKAAFALLAVFVILAAPAYAGNVSLPSEDTGSGLFHTVTAGKDAFDSGSAEPGCFEETSGKERNT